MLSLLAMFPQTRKTGAGFCASTGPRQTRGAFRNAAIGGRVSSRKIGGSMASQSGGGAAAVRKSATAEIRVKPINGFIGAEIEGVGLRRPLSPAQFKIVHDALVQYEVIVLRDQDITVDRQMAFGTLFGELSIHPFSPNLADKPEVIILDYSDKNPPALTDIWHVDETFRETPPLGTILRAKTVPEVGGDTLFASMSAAYRRLSERMKQHIHGMEALHDFKPWRPLFAHSDRAN